MPTRIYGQIFDSPSPQASAAIGSEKPLVHHLAAIAALVSLVLREYAKLLSQRAGWWLKLRTNEWRHIVSTYSGPNNFLWAPCTAIGGTP